MPVWVLQNISSIGHGGDKCPSSRRKEGDSFMPCAALAHICQVIKVVTYNLNRIIDVNYYPILEAHRSNFCHRPIGFGRGLADAFMALRMPFDSPESKELNIQIFETIYHATLEASSELAEHDGP